MSNLYKDTITIKRRDQNAVDSDGNPQIDHDTTIITSEPCRLYNKKRTEIQDNKLIVSEVLMVMLDYNSVWNIKESDRAVINSINHQIIKVHPADGASMVHHYEIEVRRIQGET